MKIIPYGKIKNIELKAQEDQTLLKDSSTPSPSNEDTGNILNDKEDKVQKVLQAIEETVGEPNLDNLAIILTAIGMSKINIGIAEDKSQISVSGIISLSEDDKIKRDKK